MQIFLYASRTYLSLFFPNNGNHLRILRVLSKNDHFPNWNPEIRRQTEAKY